MATVYVVTLASYQEGETKDKSFHVKNVGNVYSSRTDALKDARSFVVAETGCKAPEYDGPTASTFICVPKLGVVYGSYAIVNERQLL